MMAVEMNSFYSSVGGGIGRERAVSFHFSPFFPSSCSSFHVFFSGMLCIIACKRSAHYGMNSRGHRLDVQIRYRHRGFSGTKYCISEMND